MLKFWLLIALFAVIFAKTEFNVMMPLETVNLQGDLTFSQDTIESWFSKLKNAGVDGVMLDVWWGLVERKPKIYDFKAYKTIAYLCSRHGLKLQLVASFHTCGGNIGDAISIGLPDWVEAIGRENPDIYYKDQWGNSDPEYLTLGIDDMRLLNGRTPVEVYSDFVKELLRQMKPFLKTTVNEIQVGLGPCGELRYPSYQLSRWNFPGVGAFQCWDKYMLADFRNAAAARNPDWTSPPTDAGGYNSKADDTLFFKDGYKTAYGRFFMAWYSTALSTHGFKILSSVTKVNTYDGVNIAFKIAGIHWYYNHHSHAAELTAGYYNTDGQDWYKFTLNYFGVLPVTLDFTCLEMTDEEQAQGCTINGVNVCGPVELVKQLRDTAQAQGVPFAGENAIQRFDSQAFAQTLAQAKPYCSAVTWLRLGNDMFNSGNYNTMKEYVQKFHAL
eukprot:TRINITY_DN3121_c4_g5_i1.p1 TRINITY_DN3121_c4_g5~~TRINITY_DN3121_c4_g5_i1.p1  ORF type:complete len:452 (+),score=125.65 TRINITY_DN3121_c4_g5_i1:32-1357(+)